MGTVTISPKFQVVIPKAVARKLRMLPGQKLQAIAYADEDLAPVRGGQEPTAEFPNHMEHVRWLLADVPW